MNEVKEIINQLNNTIKESYPNFNGIYLYGSYAKNIYTADSDIDIIALFETSLNRQQRLNLWSLVGEIEINFNITLDLHPMTKNELEQNPIYYNQVVNKGTFYGA